MESSSLFENCQTWIERGQESWKSYFSKWETYAKYEESLTEEELIGELRERRKSRSHIKKKVKKPFSQKRLKPLLLKNRQSRHKNLIKRGKTGQKSKLIRRTTTRDEKQELNCREENLSTVTENKQLEITLKSLFSNFLKANREKNQMFAVLFQTYSHREITVTDLDNSVLRQKILPSKFCELNMANYSFEDQHTISLPLPQAKLNIRSICPNRNTYIQGLQEHFKEIYLKTTDKDWRPSQHQDTNNSDESNVNTSLSNYKFLTGIQRPQTPLLVPRLKLEAKSCPPFYPRKLKFDNADQQSHQLDLSHKFPSCLSQKTNKVYFNNTVISKMDITQERKRLGNLCLHKRTNSVSLSMGNLNFTTPERKSSEQKHFHKIPSHRRHLSKKLLFDNEENDSESDDQVEYHSPLISCQKKRVQTDEPTVVQSDSDDCDSIFDRIMKS